MSDVYEAPPIQSDSPELLARIYRLFREYFDQAEKKRRWNLLNDIPWNDCNRNLDPAIADIVETFCAVELYLPDYLAKTIPQVRKNRGRTWFFANWGYEESKHSMALGDWLLKSGKRSDEQMADMEGQVFDHEWNLPHENSRAMACYTMTQELATWLHYNRLRKIVAEQGKDPALEKLLTLIAVDERAHYDFFLRLVKIYLEFDREATIDQLRRVINNFNMPSVHMLADSNARAEAVRNLRIFDVDIFMTDVLTPILDKLGLTRQDLRVRRKRETGYVGGTPLPKK